MSIEQSNHASLLSFDSSQRLIQSEFSELTSVKEELQRTLEKLRIAQEELHKKNRMLEIAHQTLERERQQLQAAYQKIRKQATSLDTTADVGNCKQPNVQSNCPQSLGRICKV